MELFRLLVASLLLAIVNGVSNGNLPVCSVDMAIGKGTNVMKWVNAPVENTKYVISTTVGTSYHPGALTPITVTVTDIDLIYIGILLVAEAVDANGNSQVGNNTGHWTVLDGDDFFLPAACQFKAVVHKSAELKKYSHTFFWKGDLGTGTVNFRALIKQGEQNHGNFYKPANLRLTEGTPVAAQTVFKSSPGASCDETCGQQNKACDYTGTLNLKSRDALQAAVQDYYACRQPFLKTCGPPATGLNSYCYYHQCDATRTFTPIATCGRRVGDPKMDQQFCVCKAGTVVRDPQPNLYAVNQSIGYRLAAPLQLDAELTLNSLEMLDDTVTIDISGPQEKWFAIGWDARSMDGAYATVVWLDNSAIKPPQRYETFADYGYNNDKQGWYDLSCQQALNDYCRDVGDYFTPQFSCSVAGSTNQWADYVYNTSSRVPCKNGKPAPYLPMNVHEYRLSANPRGFSKLPETTTLIRGSVDSGFFRIVFTRSISGANITGAVPFPYKKTMNLIWSLGRQQYFGPPKGSDQPLKHMKKSETQVTLSLVPIYPVCALSASSTTLPSMLLLGGLAALGSKNWVLGALLAALIPHVSAHNWVNVPSRAQIAAVSVPCQQRVNPAPHLQVGPGQRFQLEWSTGHGDSPTAWAYWILLKEEAYNYLIDITDSNLDDYLNHAPSANLLIGDQWARIHVAPATSALSTAPAGNNQGGGGLFADTLTKADPRYIERNTVAVAKSLQWWWKDVREYWYVSSETAGDKRAAYKNEKYPWILSVHKFKIPNHWPDEVDMATFEFPNVAETGNYIAHFKWGGYRDCTDVHVTSFSPVQNPWGLVQSANLSATFARLDHCEYTFVLNPSTQCRVMADTSAKQCLDDCLKLDGTWGCTGVQAVLKKNPAGTLPYTPNYPTKTYTKVDVDPPVFPPLEYGPCDSRTIHKRRNCGDVQPLCNDDKIGAGADDSYICYGLTPYRDQDFQTVDDYVITTDPTDPGFYSTCWVRLAPGGFLPSPLPTKPPVVWQTGDKCLSCDWLKNVYQNIPDNAAPPWAKGLTSDCSQCDIEKATGCEADISYIESGIAGTCGDSINNGGDCSVSCDGGFNLFGDARKCEYGILTGPQQKCVFAGC